MKFSSMYDSEAGVAQRLKNTVLPSGRKVRRIPLGLARGCRMEVDFATDTRLFLGLYELELNRAIRSLCAPGSKCFDVGAYNGYDSLALGNLGATEVVAFEVVAEAAETTRRNLAANPQLPTKFEVEEAFVSNRSGDGQVAIDDYVEKSFVPDFLKIDIEGAELSALEGMPKLLAERKPHILIETHGREVEAGCVTLLRDSGYDPKVVNPRSWLPDHRPLDHNRWLIVRGKSA